MPDAFALYPQPPAPSQGVLSGDPSKIIGLVGALNQNKLFNATFDAQSRIPAATLQGQQIANDTAAFEQYAKQSDFAAKGIAALAQKGDKLTKDDINNWAVTMARNTDPRAVPSTVIDALKNRILSDPGGIKSGVNTIANMVMGPAAAAGRIEGPPDAATRAPTSVPVGAVGYGKGAPGATIPGQMPKGLPPGEGEAATATAGAAAASLSHARENSIGFQRQVFPLEQAIHALDKLGARGSGPGSDTVNHIKSFALTMGVPGVDPNKVATFDEAKKYLTDFVNQTGNSGTNDKLAAAFAGNPSVHISNAAAKDVAKAALALRRSDEARTQAFERSGLPETDYAKFAGKWNREHDVRAYGWDMMTTDQRKSVLKDLPQSKRDLFILDVEEAEKGGTIRPPRLLPVQSDKKAQ